MACINHPNLLCHEFWLCKNEDYGNPEKLWWGFVIYHGDIKIKYPNPDLATPAYEAHPKLLARIYKKLKEQENNSTTPFNHE